MSESLLSFGAPAPWFTARCTANPNFVFSSVAGRYVILCFFQSAARPDSRRILNDFIQAREHFDDWNACFFGISTDPEDERQQRVREQTPGMRYFWDFESSVSRLYGAVADAATSPVDAYHPH